MPSSGTNDIDFDNRATKRKRTVTNEGAGGSGIKEDRSSKSDDDRNDDVGKSVKRVARVAPVKRDTSVLLRTDLIQRRNQLEVRLEERVEELLRSKLSGILRSMTISQMLELMRDRNARSGGDHNVNRRGRSSSSSIELLPEHDDETDE